MIHLLIDGVAGRRRLDELRARAGDQAISSLNTTTLDGARLDLAELKAVCSALPFLSERRLVIVRGALAKQRGERAPSSRERAKTDPDAELAAYLADVPTFVDLVFLESEMPGAGTVLKTIEGMRTMRGAEIVRDAPLDEMTAPRWVLDTARGLGATMESSAAVALVEAVGVDRLTLGGEIDKLATFADGRTIRREDVQELVRSVDAGRIFELVDAIGLRRAGTALRAWRTLLRAGDDPHRLLSMVARQLRLLIQTSDVIRQGRNASDVARELGISTGVAPRLAAQTRNWSLDAIEAAFARVVELDHDAKTGGPELGPSLEGLIAELVAVRR